MAQQHGWSRGVLESVSQSKDKCKLHQLSQLAQNDMELSRGAEEVKAKIGEEVENLKRVTIPGGGHTGMIIDTLWEHMLQQSFG